ncbi:conserved membrane hypothetical protein [Hyella patelloides LEGE 07179]|uniref:DUF1206 domain-containing protein n=1 Tax=Hyella patelloides LEGE 07179 TaxID=945734 RepID=A0A563VZ27_9CYAN|nr:DUF1206 domain-containing protein [Hyella patelloides]VEP16655.1 conserved membrane hypothetical protein [Hyella patelloides LEGE 07179]
MKQWFHKAIANPWLRQYILVGYAAKGTVYLLIGTIAIQAAVISDRKAAGTYLTLTWLADRPWGKLLVCLIAIALTGYVLRRLLQAILISEAQNPFSLKSILQCLGYIMSGLSYAGVAHSALNIVFELGEYDDTIEDLANQLFEQPIGGWLIFLGGIAVTIIGFSYIYGAYSGSYISEFQSSDIHHRLEKWATRIGKLGVSARGVAFILTGIFLIQAAIYGNSELAGGLQNAFRVLATKPMGWLWLSLIGLGLICYGLYMFVAAGYRRYAIR